MINDKTQNLRKIIENITILLIVFFGIANIILSMPYVPFILDKIGLYYENFIHPNLQFYWLLRRIHWLYPDLYFLWAI